jgi:hypothetical protein
MGRRISPRPATVPPGWLLSLLLARGMRAEASAHASLFTGFFRHLAVGNAEDADPRPRGRLTGRRDAAKSAFLGSDTFPVGDHLVPFGNEVPFQAEGGVRKSRAKLADHLLHALTAAQLARQGIVQQHSGRAQFVDNRHIPLIPEFIKPPANNGLVLF